ncbi:enoyl-CoA hydratase-related protein [Asticcacaulis machinosus]|uniref:Enoyl-CoA hydratase-related protein n=1 Tax=Asticcacaulis machinosus TaxID=2984211 RepID=A0ABT5HK32_9CAUL|nr:enoyl-CoA hydratase-related protein [Asticcacaulis machinosus]MDC7676604.1 enoyl-CoA hydratase-related protein [Asticcacaulis machinosus]
MSSLSLHIANGIARVILNRPERHNAFDGALIDDLEDTFGLLARDAAIRVIVLTHSGHNFCAGADLEWMAQTAAKPEAENRADALKMARMFQAINTCPKPVIGLVRGRAIGGGVGLVACCDIVIAAPDASFCLSEVKLGLIPAVISPFVTAKIGVSQARRFMISAETFDAATALRIGLIHQVSSEEEVLTANLITGLMCNAPQAMAEVKTLLTEVADKAIDDNLLSLCADRIADRRASREGGEGMQAFLDKRKADWVPDV